MKKIAELWKRGPWVLLFALFILLYTLLDMTQTNRVRSELENRPLNMRPKLTWSLLMSGDYDEKFDSYINDQFVGRDMWITLKSWAESALLKTENNGVVYGKDDYLFLKTDTLDTERYIPNTRYVREFFEMYPALPVTFAVVPNSYAVLSDKLPAGLELVDQKQYIGKLCEGLPQNVQPLDLIGPLEAEKDEYIYYRTDHHWTTRGAYIAASAYAESKNLVLPPLEEIPSHTVEGFYGTNFSKAKKAGARPDEMVWYDVPLTSIKIDGQEKDGLYDMEKFGVRDKYAAYLWGNNNFTEIKSENNLNRREGQTTRLLLIKDSYGNSLAPFMTYLYDEVDVIDLRYVQKLSPYLAAKTYDDVLLMYNFESLSTDGHISTLRY